MTRDIDQVRVLRGDAERIRSSIERNPEAVFGTSGGPPGRFHADLVVDLGDGASMHQIVALELGLPEPLPGRIEYPLRWEAVGHQRLLPTFAGRMAIVSGRDSSQLRIWGTYRAPLGPVGTLGDVVGGQRVAQRSLAAFVDEVAWRIDRAVDHDLATTWRPPPGMVDLRPGDSQCGLG
jgi:hypothetical protein